MTMSQIAEGFLHGLKLLEGVAGIVAGFEIEGVNQFQCFGVARGAEVVAEGGEKFGTASPFSEASRKLTQ